MTLYQVRKVLKKGKIMKFREAFLIALEDQTRIRQRKVPIPAPKAGGSQKLQGDFPIAAGTAVNKLAIPEILRSLLRPFVLDV
jgi:hypothetical protein